MCPSLTLQQVYKLTEHHHDDWITGSQTTDTLVLLQTLKRIVDATVRPRVQRRRMPCCCWRHCQGTSRKSDSAVTTSGETSTPVQAEGRACLVEGTGDSAGA